MMKYIFNLSFFGFFFLLFACNEVQESSGTQSTEPLIAPNDNIRQLDEMIINEPDNAKLYEMRGDAFFKLEGYDEAIVDYEKAMNIEPGNLIYPQKLAAVYMDYGRSRKAYNVMTAASFQFPDSIDLQLKYAEYQIILKKNNDAFQTLQKVLKLDRHNAVAYFMMGVNFKDVDEIEKAIASLQTAVDKDSDFVDAWMLLGYIYDEKDDPLAAKFFDNAIASEPEYLDAYLAKGNHYGNQGKFNDAIKVFRQLNVMQQGQNADAIYNIALSYVQMDSLNQAFDNFKICTKLEPTYTKAYYYLGFVSQKMGKLDQAKEYYQQTLNLDPEFERAEKGLAELQK